MRRGRSRRVPLNLGELNGRAEIFRLSGAVRRSAAVEDWLRDEPLQLRSIASTWFSRMRACGDDVAELLHDGGAVACVDDAPFAYVNTFASHVNVGFFYGALLEDAAGLLQGSGKRMRHVKLSPDRPATAAALEVLIDASYADIRARLRAERSA